MRPIANCEHHLSNRLIANRLSGNSQSQLNLELGIASTNVQAQEGFMDDLSAKEVSEVRPADCECDNTHEQNNTCCMPCWEAGFRTVPTESEGL